MDTFFEIGSLPFRISAPQTLPLPAAMELFRSGGREAEYTYEIALSDRPPVPEGRLIARRANLLAFGSDAGESRLLGWPGVENPYAFYRELSPDRAEITLSPCHLESLAYETVFCSLLALERRMILRDAMILHCAYTRYRGRALLFSAPSETGKTTQANLWERFRGAETINGDRALLERCRGVWTARGWPVCGSSGVCRREDTPIGAIVMLSQGPDNRVRRLSGAESLRLLFPQITVNLWNETFTGRVMDLLAALLADVPLYHLSCTISEEAVDCLDAALSEDFK